MLPARQLETLASGKKDSLYVEKGLSSSLAKERLNESGPNILPEKPPEKSIVIFLSQIKSPLVYVLLLAGLVMAFLSHTSDALIIFIAVAINTTLGFVQEKKASSALTALKKLVTFKVEVIRDGQRTEIDASGLVVGDIVILGQGKKVPADGRLVEVNRFFADEAVLTGESIPVSKKQFSEVFMGTVVVGGTAVMIVEKTGSNTQMGAIAAHINEPQEDTPLKNQLSDFAKNLVLLVIGLTAFVFLIGIVLGRGLGEMFITSVALAVSAIPEGLLVGLTVVLAIGMQRILKRRGLVRRLVSAETLGGVTTICLDKTGTLTEGKMRVVEVIGNREEMAEQMVVANDLDDPIVIGAFNWAKQIIGETALKASKLKIKEQKLDSLPFSAKMRFYASLNKYDHHQNVIFVNGAPDYLLKWSKMPAGQRSEVQKQIDGLTKKGRRLIGLARTVVPSEKTTLKTEDITHADLEWIGLLAFSDPVREGVAQALKQTRQAGIKLKIITGDYAQTAIAVMNELGIQVEKEEVLTGEELAKMSLAELIKKLDKIILFARTTPQQKLKIVKALKHKGEIVAMMGDGVNDAPALNTADIGIVVGDATDVARESADLVLLDSQFGTVVAAVEEGRGIFDNIRKIIIYLMSTAFNEITAVVATILLGLPLPVSAAQILWINIVSDGFPDLALTVDPKRAGIMDEAPRLPGEKLVTSWMKILIAIISVTSGILALGLFVFSLHATGDLGLARSIAFVSLGANSLIYVFSVRTLKEPFWKEGFFENKWLIAAVGVGLLLQLLPFATPSLRNFFQVTIIPLNYWLAVAGVSLLTFIIIEILKYVFRHPLKFK